MYVLYGAPGAASLCVHQALLELGVPFELRLLDTEKREHKTPEYLKLNPAGVVPTLVIDGKPHVESGALLMILAARHPEAKLAPDPGTTAHAEYLQWIVHLSNALQAPFRLWFYPSDGIDDPSQHDAVKASARRRIEAVFDRLDAHLAGRTHVAGDAFSMADLFATMLMRWSRNMPKPATAWPNLRAYADRMRARPSWAELCVREGLSEWRA